MAGNEFAQAFDEALASDAHGIALWYARPGEPLDVVTRRELDALARRLEAGLRGRGARPGGYVVLDAPNCPLLAAAVLAASRMGCALVTLNARLSAAEKALRLRCLAEVLGKALPEALDEEGLARIASEGAGLAAGRASGPAAPGGRTSVVMFTSGTTGTPKAVPLTWDNLCGSARAANARLGCGASDGALWQAALPMCHVGGLQMLVRSVLAARPLVLYRSFDAARMLEDARALGATHASVVNKTLADLLGADDARAAQGLPRVLPSYACLLLGGAVPAAPVLARARERGAHVFASFGMTETASLVACAEVGEGFDGWMSLLDGYEAHADEAGQISLAGPGVTSGYLNAPTPRTAAGALLTGDAGEVAGGCLRVRERVGDMFVSGGENVYPAEVEAALRELPGVRDACVLGVPDATWGRRPVAFVEAPDATSLSPRDTSEALRGATAARRGEQVRAALAGRLSRIMTPDRVWCVPELARMGIGKPDRSRMLAADAARLRAVRVDMFLVEQPFARPVQTPKATLRTRRSLLVRVTDASGRTGLAEGVAFETPWYLPETMGADVDLLASRLVPAVLGETFLDPGEVASFLRAEVPESASQPMALAALEPAFWDLHAQARGISLARLLALEAGMGDVPEPAGEGFGAPAGAVVGLCGVGETLARVDELVRAGYGRVKLKVRPGDDVARVCAVRDAYPELVVSLDANQSYADGDVDALLALDDLGVACIEEPLAPRAGLRGRVEREELWGRLERLQGRMDTPVCLDESFTTGQEAFEALREHPGLRCFALKIAKFAGVAGALEFWRAAREAGALVWMAGMFDTSVSKRLHAAFEALPGMLMPGDVCGTGGYFTQEVARPALAVRGGCVLSNSGGRCGLGCVLDDDVVAARCVRSWTFTA